MGSGWAKVQRKFRLPQRLEPPYPQQRYVAALTSPRITRCEVKALILMATGGLFGGLDWRRTRFAWPEGNSSAPNHGERSQTA